VVAVSPAPGTKVARQTAVALVVSSGPPRVAVPSVVGMPLATASDALGAAGLRVGSVADQPSSSVPSGDVVAVSPAPGTKVAPGTAVSLAIAVTPSPAAKHAHHKQD
jgi:beta-lactam-binding protein with PASTA domain